MTMTAARCGVREPSARQQGSHRVRLDGMLSGNRVFGACVVGAALLVAGCSSGGRTQSAPTTTKVTTATSAPTTTIGSAAKVAQQQEIRAGYLALQKRRQARVAQLRALQVQSWMQKCDTVYPESAVRTACIAAATHGVSPESFQRKRGP
jgi:hypothetical protein